MCSSKSPISTSPPLLLLIHVRFQYLPMFHQTPLLLSFRMAQCHQEILLPGLFSIGSAMRLIEFSAFRTVLFSILATFHYGSQTGCFVLFRFKFWTGDRVGVNCIFVYSPIIASQSSIFIISQQRMGVCVYTCPHSCRELSGSRLAPSIQRFWPNQRV